MSTNSQTGTETLVHKSGTLTGNKAKELVHEVELAALSLSCLETQCNILVLLEPQNGVFS